MALTLGNLLKSQKKKRPGVHSKSKTSNSKQAKNYKKKYYNINANQEIEKINEELIKKLENY